jgi:predicted nuclease of predicted toxin-antitoxin system
VADRVRFHLDEHIDPDIARALRSRGIDLTTTVESGLRTATDGAQLAFAIREGRSFVTGDFRMLALLSGIEHHAGAVMLNRGRLSVSQQIRGLLLIYDVLTADDMVDHVEYVT